jgi:hypothetical protein
LGWPTQNKLPHISFLTVFVFTPAKDSQLHHGHPRQFLGSFDLRDHSHILWLCMACYAPGYASMVDSRRTLAIHHTNAKKSNHSVGNPPTPLKQIANGL